MSHLGAKDADIPDAPPYPASAITEREWDDKYPNRPRNRGKTLPFRELFLTLFNPLNDNKKKPSGPVIARKKQGLHGPVNHSPQEARRIIIERFVSKWRHEVGNDIFPAFRLIVPEKDRDRGMYGLKEKAIGKVLVKVMQISKNSEDGYNLLNWKLPGQSVASRMAGDFAGRCFEVISKRPILTEPGGMTFDEVNDLLDRLSAEQKEEGQFPIFQEFYTRMNPTELMWLIRIILRQMKIGATERTLFDVWHPDAESLFSVSSSLRRVCWELYDPSVRLESEERGVTLMQCFQPQLAQFQMHSFQKMVDKMRPTEQDNTFWIEEKLDGERMQMHMISESSLPGGKKFAFWSRKAKDYTYLYGNGFFDDNAALTRHLTTAFNERVQSIILDGEMITWDPEQDAIVPFGTLKTAALAEQRNPFSNTGQRPLYRVFDILYLNGKALTDYTLRDRRNALEKSVKSVSRRLEIHTYLEASKAEEIEPLLRKVVAEASEGLVLKNPRSPYRLNDRNDDWMKVKPEYMTEFGESLDCIIIGGYYGSGHRGGNLSSFLCGLRVDENFVSQGGNAQKCWSFFKVGGGFTAADYATIRHQTEGKWKDWDAKHPPKDWVELGGGDAQHERPDVWIRPDESLVVEVKAASITATDQFRMGLTLRFPRFKRIRSDRDWQSALSVQGFLDLKNNVESEKKDKQFKVDDERRKRTKHTMKRAITVAGSGVNDIPTPYGGPRTKVFDGLTFYIMSESIKPQKKSKKEIEEIVKANGGTIRQTYDAAPDTICIADKRVVKVAALEKIAMEKFDPKKPKLKLDIIRPSWIFHCIWQGEADGDRSTYLLPFEPNHVFFAKPGSTIHADENLDPYRDSYARNVKPVDLEKIFDNMPKVEDTKFSAEDFLGQLGAHGHELDPLRGWLFRGLIFYFDALPLTGDDTVSSTGLALMQARTTAGFASAELVEDIGNENITHVVVVEGSRERTREIRRMLAHRSRLPRIVRVAWVEECWKEGTLIDEERFSVV